MFGNKATNNPSASTTFISNRINQGTTIEGAIDSDSDLRIEGVIKGTLKTKSKVAVGPTGLIEGDVFCKNADIEGKVTGDLEVSELLTLKSTCIVEGNIYTSKILIENGARFNGLCTMGSKEKKSNAERTIPIAEKEAV